MSPMFPEAQDLLMQASRKREANVLLISELYKCSENSAWYRDASRRAGILVCSLDYGIRKVSVRLLGGPS